MTKIRKTEDVSVLVAKTGKKIGAFSTVNNLIFRFVEKPERYFLFPSQKSLPCSGFWSYPPPVKKRNCVEFLKVLKYIYIYISLTSNCKFQLAFENLFRIRKFIFK